MRSPTVPGEADGHRPTPAVVLAAGVLAAGPVALAFASGAFFSRPRLVALLGAAALLAWLAATAPRVPRSRGAWCALGAVALLAGWVALSRGRSPLPATASGDAERVLLYAAALLAGATAWRSRAAARAAEPLVAAGTLVVVGYGLSGRLLPGIVHLHATASAGGRLEQPLTYWNAMGMLAALGAVLCARVAGDDGRAPWLRGAAAASAVPLLAGVYLSFSRGAVAALAAGLLVLLLCAPRWSQLRAVAITLEAGAVGVGAAALLPGVRALSGSAGAREHDGLLALAVLVTAAGAAAALTAWAVREERRAAVRLGALRLPRAAGWLVAAIIVLAVVGPVVAARNQGAGRDDQAGFGASTQRFASVSSNRYAYWRVALRSFAGHPLAGVGSGGFGTEWLRERPITEAARDAHSIEIETLAELGLVGAALLALLVGGVARCAVVVQRRDPELAAGACAGLTVWLAHSALDWDWELPAATLPALTLAAVLVARSAPATPSQERTARDRSRSARQGAGGSLGLGALHSGGRLLLGAAAVGCAVVAVGGLRSDHRCRSTFDRARALTASTARQEGPAIARVAVGDCEDPLTAVEIATYLGAAGRRGDAEAVARTLTERQPQSYLGWLVLGRLQRLDDPAAARPALARAHALNPRGVPAAG